MPVFRNLKSRRSSGRIPIAYDEQGWETVPHVLAPYPHNAVSSPHSSATSSTPSTPFLPEADQSPPARKTKSSRRADPGHVPRPRNAFIFFRSYFNQISGSHDQNSVSVRAGRTWNELGDAEKRPFLAMAEKEKKEHQAKFPNYTYAPGAKANGVKRKAASKRKVKPAVKKAPAPRPAYQLDPSPAPSTPSLPAILAPIVPQFTFLKSPKPILDLTATRTPSPESFFSPNWSFVPTSEIPPLELSPARSPKDVDFDLSLRPPTYDLIHESFGMKSSAIPQTMENFFPTNLHYDYTPFAWSDFDSHPSAALGASPAPFHSEWDLVAQMISSQEADYSYIDFENTHKTAPNSQNTYLNFDDVFLTYSEHEQTTTMPTSEFTMFPHSDECLMNQYLNL